MFDARLGMRGPEEMGSGGEGEEETKQTVIKVV